MLTIRSDRVNGETVFHTWLGYFFHFLTGYHDANIFQIYHIRGTKPGHRPCDPLTTKPCLWSSHSQTALAENRCIKIASAAYCVASTHILSLMQGFLCLVMQWCMDIITHHGYCSLSRWAGRFLVKTHAQFLRNAIKCVSRVSAAMYLNPFQNPPTHPH